MKFFFSCVATKNVLFLFHIIIGFGIYYKFKTDEMSQYIYRWVGL